MDLFCGSPLWQYNLTWDVSAQPDLTPCFQETILVWLPCIILWLFTPLEIISIYRSERRYIPVTILNLFKTFLATVLCLLSLSELIDTLTSTTSTADSIAGSGVNPVQYVTPIVKSLTYVLVFSLNVLHRNRGVHTSGLLFAFWLLMSVASVINIRSIIISAFHDHSENTVHTVAEWNLTEFKSTIRIVSAPIVIIQLVLSCIADKKANDPFVLTGGDYRNQSPENEASILSLITFWWLNSIMWLGYKRALTQDDLYAIKPDESTEIVSHKFDKYLIPAIQKALDEQRATQTFMPSFGDNKQLCDTNNDDNTATKTSPLIKNRSNEINSSNNSVNSKNNQRLSDEDKGKLGRKDRQQSTGNEGGKYVGVTRIIIKTFWPYLLASSVLKLISSLLTFASPLLLSCIITFISTPTEPSWRGSLYASALFLLSMTQSIFDNREQYMTNLNVMRIRTCLTSAIYRKTLRLSNQGRKNYTTGEIVNLMSTDTQRVADLVQNINSIWAAPLQLTISMVLLYQQLGAAIFAGLCVMLINIPFNVWITNKLRTLQQLVMRYKDQRIKLLSELVNGIKIIKIHAWEDSFKRRAEAIRSKEIKFLTKQTWYSAAITFAFTCLPFIVALASFATFVLVDVNNVLDANKVFVSLSLFNIIRIPLAILPMLLTNISMFLVSVRRVNRFLEGQEIDPNAAKQIDEDNNAIKINGGTFKWELDGEVVLDKISMEVPRRKLVAIVGSVGAGKSSLISAILGDLDKYEGEVLLDREASISYVPQEAWVLNTTFKNNIMFNKVVNEERYQRVLDACALVPDIKTLEQGDQSEIGEKGINLSGGQKQRISLARAVYADTDIYLMDDPLNAVDVHVGRHIFDHVIGPKGMLRDRTRLLVTNKLSVLPEVDHIIVLKDGKVSEKGSYEQLLKSRGLFSQLLVKYLLENKNTTDNSQSNLVNVAASRVDLITKELKRLEDEQAKRLAEEANEKKRANTGTRGGGHGKQNVETSKSVSHGHRSGQGGEDSRGLTGQEVTQVGSVGIEVHRNFVRAMGLNFVIATAIYIASSAFTLSSNLWLSDWSNDAQNETLRTDTKLRDLRLGVYAGLGLGESTCVIVSTVLLNLACLRSSHMLHNRMLSRVLRAPLAWFNVTPSGRIINRFSKDIDTVDVTIRFNVRLLMVVALRSVTSLILISVGSVYSIMLIAPIVLLYFLFQMFYISTSRQLKRIESATKSPIYSHFSETIMGASSIRAFRVTQEFILESNHRVDVNNASYYIGFVSSRWLAIRLEFLGLIVVLTASLVAVLSRDVISPGIAGLSVTYSLTVTQVLSFLVRTYSDYETNVVSVERLLEYTRTPVEPDDEEEPSDPNWPARGEVHYDNYSARYRPELELVLNKFNLKINSTERVGLVGRTGSGKSSVTLALFRILDITDGRIVIDDVDISHINLKVLRSKLSIIPQEPILFTGTIRQNIDPTESHPDHEIWRAIDLAHLGSFLRQLPSGLEYQVSEGGNNFSVGQKQLFCLARTLLRRSKILILDEATAAVDVETDNLIQQTIRQEFRESTILTIAHRLETIQDYDRVVVMESGRSVEEGKPTELLANSKTKFYHLAHDSSSQ